MMAFEGYIPARADLDEGFQPKLYHGTVAAIWRLIPDAPNAILNAVAHFVSCLAGILTLLVAAHFLRATRHRGKATLVTLALIAFCPPLVAINGQATNDSFVILFGTVALWFGWRFFTDWKLRDGIGLTVATVLAILSKGNGFVLLIAVAITCALSLALQLCSRARTALGTRALLLYTVLIPLVTGVVTWTLGPYGDHQRRYGSAFVINREVPPFPNVFEKTYVRRPGLTSIADGLLTFHYVDLLLHPQNVQGSTDYPLHRTSMWSQLYGRAHSVHFDAWPRPWASFHPVVRALTRLTFLLALLPTLVLAVAVVRAVRRMLADIFRASRNRDVNFGRVLLTTTALGYIAFVMAYSVRYRDFAVMKTIFMLPALLGFALLFQDECMRLYVVGDRRPRWRRAVTGAFVLLVICYALDEAILILRLAR